MINGKEAQKGAEQPLHHGRRGLFWVIKCFIAKYCRFKGIKKKKEQNSFVQELRLPLEGFSVFAFFSLFPLQVPLVS